jgi:hypothetical protein
VRLARLYLRSRLIPHATAVLAVVALATWGTACWILSPSGTPERLVVVLVFAPLAAACVLGASTHSPFGDTERVVPYSLPLLRLGHLVGLLLLVAPLLCLTVASPQPDAKIMPDRIPDYPALVMTRNLIGSVGFAFLAARAVGAYLSWTLPVTFVLILPLVAGGTGGMRWAWPAQPATDGLSWAIALVLFVVGLAAVVLWGTATQDGEPG